MSKQTCTGLEYDDIELNLNKIKILVDEARDKLAELDKWHKPYEMEAFFAQYGAVEENLDYLTYMIMDYIDEIREINNKLLEKERNDNHC